VRRATRALHFVSAYLAIPMMIALVVYDVFLRYVVSDPSVWANEVSAVLLILVVFATLPHLTIQREHLGNDMIYLMLGGRGKRVTAGAGYLCGAIFGGVLAFRSFTAMLDAQRYNEGTQNVDFPFWPFYAVMALSAAFVVLICFLQIATALIGEAIDTEPDHGDQG
jgi:TRAP-type C4-dicarboxylate transport system permease small subunit